MTPTEKALKANVEIDMLLEKLAFSDEGVIPAALEQPVLMREISRYVAKKRRALAEAEIDQEVLKSDLALKIRSSNKEKKPTEANIKEMLYTDKKFVGGLRKIAACEVEYEWAKNLKDAYQHRMQVLKIVANANESEAMLTVSLGKDKEKLAKLKKGIKERYPESDENEL